MPVGFLLFRERKRMVRQCVLDRDKLQIFNGALREEKSIEGIACRWLGLHMAESMMFSDRQKRHIGVSS